MEYWKEFTAIWNDFDGEIGGMHEKLLSNWWHTSGDHWFTFSTGSKKGLAGLWIAWDCFGEVYSTDYGKIAEV